MDAPRDRARELFERLDAHWPSEKRRLKVFANGSRSDMLGAKPEDPNDLSPPDELAQAL